MKKANSELVEARNTLESIWIAIVLAFVLRAFLVEAFVIPTGSMAPRLMGMHVEITCPDCGYSYPRGVGIDDQGRKIGDPESHCPNCGEDATITAADRVCSGDRVLVLKLPEFLRPLKRWDVVVFKDPNSNQQNFIKRLVGLPGEALRIIHGDLFRLELSDVNGDGVLDENDLPGNPADQDGWRIVRKDYDEQQALWQMLYDSEYAPANRPERLMGYRDPWTQVAGAPGCWNLAGNSGRDWRFDPSGEPGGATIGYAEGRSRMFLANNPYNSRGYSVDSLCSDLRLETIATADKGGVLRLVLGSFEHRFAAEWRPAEGRLRLLHAMAGDDATTLDWSVAEGWDETQLDVQPGDPLRLAIFHADWRVGVCVDDKPVLLSRPEQYDVDANDLAARMAGRDRAPTPAARIEAAGGGFALQRTRLLRDVFYTRTDLGRSHVGPAWDYARESCGIEGDRSYPGWASQNNPMVLRKYPEQRRHLDEFFMCGDNSPASHDSRRWIGAAPSLRLYDDKGDPQYRLGTVPRYNLIGKAFFVYWPGGGQLVGRNWEFRDASKMRRIK